MSEPLETDFIKKAEETAKEYAQKANLKGEGLPSPVPSNDESRNIATLCHLSMIVLGPLVAIFVYLLKPGDQFIAENAKEDINLSITLTIIGFILTISIIGWLLLWVVWVVNFVAAIYLAIKSSEGKTARLPFLIRFMK